MIFCVECWRIYVRTSELSLGSVMRVELEGWAGDLLAGTSSCLFGYWISVELV
jgi:hypothetical protein